VSEETVEIEIDEESIVGYLVDEDDNEVGVLYVNEKGEEVELYYDDCEQVQIADEGDEDVTDGDEVDEDVEELEIDPDSILYYFVDAKGRELGFAALNEEGKKEEFMYPEDAVGRFYLLAELEKKLSQATGVKGAAGNLVSAGTNAVGGVVNKVAGKEVVKVSGAAPAKSGGTSGEEEGMTKDDWSDMFSTFKEVAVSGYSAITGVMDQVDDVRDSLDEINPKKRRQNRKAKKDTEAAVAAALASQQQTAAATATPVVTPVASAAAAAAPAGEGVAAPAAGASATEVTAAPAAGASAGDEVAAVKSDAAEAPAATTAEPAGE
jgi:hypothetical protein